jgi:hypothetical protein
LSLWIPDKINGDPLRTRPLDEGDEFFTLGWVPELASDLVADLFSFLRGSYCSA